MDPLADVPCPEAHPRLRASGLLLWGRWAAYEATAVGAVFGAWVLADVTWRKVTGKV